MVRKSKIVYNFGLSACYRVKVSKLMKIDGFPERHNSDITIPPVYFFVQSWQFVLMS